MTTAYHRGMVTIFRCAAVLLLLLTQALAQEQPVNVMIGDLTFIRPEGWRWEEPANKSVAESRFVISGFGTKQLTDCRFYYTKDGWDHSRAVWRTHFSRRGEPTGTHEEKVKTKAGSLTFLSIDGDYAVNEKHSLTRNARLVGTIIPSGTKFVRIRLVGPKADVEKATPEFKKMIVDAFEQRAAER